MQELSPRQTETQIKYYQQASAEFPFLILIFLVIASQERTQGYLWRRMEFRFDFTTTETPVIVVRQVIVRVKRWAFACSGCWVAASLSAASADWGTACPQSTWSQTEGLEFLPCPFSDALEEPVHVPFSEDGRGPRPVPPLFQWPSFPLSFMAIALLPSSPHVGTCGSNVQKKIGGFIDGWHLCNHIASRRCVMEWNDKSFYDHSFRCRGIVPRLRGSRGRSRSCYLHSYP